MLERVWPCTWPGAQMQTLPLVLLSVAWAAKSDKDYDRYE